MVSIKLKKSDVVKYSPHEQRLFSLLPVGRRNRVDTSVLVKKFYNGRKPPVNGRLIITGTLSSLMRKTKYNDEPFTIERTARSGPHPIEVWVET